MIEMEEIKGKTAYAGGSTTVNIRENVTTESRVIGNVRAGRAMGTATGAAFHDLDPAVAFLWIEIAFSGGRLGYVREDVLTFTAPAQNPSTVGSGSGSATDTLKTAFDSDAGGFPKWAVAAVVLCLAMTGFAVWLLIRKKKKK